MAKFSSPEKQAEKAVSHMLGIGNKDGQIKSIGTARNYKQSLTQCATYLKENRLGNLAGLSTEVAQKYLEARAEQVSQKTLDLDRQAIQAHLSTVTKSEVKLERTRSEIDSTLSTRSYTSEQVAMVSNCQAEKNALSTEIAHAAGLRAHELLTLRPADERAPSGHREWSESRFVGREGVRYTVDGKGGLVREVMIPKELSDRLEDRRIEATVVTDRGIKYESRYDIGGGRNWSLSFSRASSRELGWSNGAHGLRHSYAQERMNELQSSGRSYSESLGIVSQELGHFRPDITEVYLR